MNRLQREVIGLFFTVLDAVKTYWLQFLLATSSISLAKALSDDLVFRHPKGGAAKLARFVLGCYIALFFYALFYYVTTLITGWI
jgi:hypothetical protein